jgi:hypothetical protein
MSRPFHPSELSGAAGGNPGSGDLAEALATARELEGHLQASDVHPSAGFVDGVMHAIGEEARPQPAVAAGLAMRQGRLRAMAGALGDSWRVAFTGGRPLAVRAQAAAFVLVAILALGSLGGVLAVGAVRLLEPVSPPPPTHVAPTAEPTEPPGRTSSPSPSPSSGPQGPTTEPSETPEPSETAEPPETPEPGDTAEPGRTPRPTHSAEPTETPEPTETDDSGHGGGGGGGGGGGSFEP